MCRVGETDPDCASDTIPPGDFVPPTGAVFVSDAHVRQVDDSTALSVPEANLPCYIPVRTNTMYGFERQR